MIRSPLNHAQGSLRPNWSNTINQRLVALFDTRRWIEVVSGVRASAKTSTLLVGRGGLGADFSGTLNQQFSHRAAFAQTGALTIVAFCDVDTLSSYGAIISKAASSTANVPYELRLGTHSG